MIIRIFYILFLAFSINVQTTAQNVNASNDNSFEFAFLTDIHIRPDMNAPIGFQMAIDKVNELNPDFVLTGGDLVFDAMRGNQQKSDSLFTLYTSMIKGFKIPVYNCIGNHDLFAIYPESPESDTHPDYKYGMFERYFGKSYYSFDHKGWHFIVLNSLDVTEDNKYKGHFHEKQLEWLKSDLENVNKSTPIVIVSHLPMLSVRGQVAGTGGNSMIDNVSEVFKIIDSHNLKLILQGHIHWKENGFVNDRFHYITGGSIAGNGWKGRRHNTKEGFIMIKVNGDDFSWEYIDHGWENERIRLDNVVKSN